MARVWRWQREDGLGPYRGDARGAFDGEWSSTQCPPPADDFELVRQAVLVGSSSWAAVKPYRFGFPTPGSEGRWFTQRDRERMREEGYRLVELEAEEVIVSDSGKQCMFRPETAREVVP